MFIISIAIITIIIIIIIIITIAVITISTIIVFIKYAWQIKPDYQLSFAQPKLLNTFFFIYLIYSKAATYKLK